MATSTEIKELWRILETTYDYATKDKTPEERALKLALYRELLADLPIEALQAAVKQHIVASRFFPTIAELRELAAAALPAPAENSRTALEAWGDVRRAVEGYYPYADAARGPEIADPLARAVVRDMGGLSYLFHTDNLVADRARFLEDYTARQKRAQAEAKLLPEVRAVRDRLAAVEREKAAGAAANLFRQVADKLRLDRGQDETR